MNDNTFSRRQFLGAATLAAAGTALSGSSFGFPAIISHYGKPNSKFKGVQVGTITYSFRSLPCDVEKVIQYCKEANVSALELMGNTAEAFAGAPHTTTEPRQWDRREPTPEERAERAARAKEIADWRAKVPMDKFAQLKKMFKSAGISIYAFKPNAFGVNNTDAEIDYGMRAAKALGATHITLEMPNEAAQTKRLADIAVRHQMLVAYHGHEQQHPTFWDAALAESPYNALNCDLGHYVAAGHDPVELIKAKYARIASAHLKDRQTAANGKGNLVWGTGNTPIAKILQTMQQGKYEFPATVELEYQIPEGSDAVKEVAKCVEFCKKILIG